jgi:hypothetical protein
MVAWFFGGIAASAILIVVIPPLDLVLLFVLLVIALVRRAVYRVRDPYLVATLLGVVAVSLYTLSFHVVPHLVHVRRSCGRITARNVLAMPPSPMV